mgnify:CR=1 FL=1
MATTLPAHLIQWTTASPLWTGDSPNDPTEQTRMQRPALLTFKSDQFVRELTALLQVKKPDLTSYLARPETFHELLPGEAPTTPTTLKLYQPAHGRHHLVVASLVCRLPGLPDRLVDRRKDEKVGFVLRRLAGDGSEMAWIPGAPGTGVWQKLSSAAAELVADGEELNGLFPMTFGVNGSRRRILVGNIPVASKETFDAAGIGALRASPADDVNADSPNTPRDTRMDVADNRIIAVLDRLHAPIAGGESNDQRDARIEQEKNASRFLLLDLWDFLKTWIPSILNTLGTRPQNGDRTQSLWDRLHDSNVDNKPGAKNWLQSLALLTPAEIAILIGDKPENSQIQFNARDGSLGGIVSTATLRQAIVTALDPAKIPTTFSFPDEGTLQVGKLAPIAAVAANATSPFGAGYRIRCVYQRPNCGPIHPPIVSKPSETFELAPFFDPDAPARPIRITLPVDTSIAGLRKFKKNVGFVFSNQLRNQMSKIGPLKDVMDGKLDGGGSWGLGEICMFSIPIITICAMIVLMIFISLLNIIFWWIPLLRICIPIPVKK